MEPETLDTIVSYTVMLIPLVTFAGGVVYAFWKGL